jgi:hypothetical protein
MILADDVLAACRELGISDGRRYAPPQSFAVELYAELANIVWPVQGANPRKIFERLRRYPITRRD